MGGLGWANFIPEKAIPFVQFLIEQHHFTLKIVNQRQTKHGDFRQLQNGKFQITVNNNLNKYQFLLTLIHEIAHHVTHQKFGRVQPHGKEWKTVFQHLMLPFLQPEIYPKEILPYLANYLKNPKASTDTDVNLSLALRGNIAEAGKSFIFEIPNGSLFEFKKTLYKRGNKRRTRFECLNMNNKKTYLFNQNAEIKVVKDVDAYLASKKSPTEAGKSFIFEIPNGSLFEFKNTLYKRGNKRRTRFECLNLDNKEIYLFNQNVEIKVVKDVDDLLASKRIPAEDGKSFIFEIPYGSLFEFKNTLYKRGNKRRTRFECLNMNNNEIYLFNQNVKIKVVKNE